MRLNQDELLFLNHVTEGEPPFGMFLRYPPNMEVSSYKNKVMRSLLEKGIIDTQQKFTKEGVAILLLWEEYRNCKKHVVLNHILMAVLPNRRVIGIIKKEHEFEIFSTDSAAIMLALLKKYDFLCLGNTEGNYHLEKYSYADWAKEMEQYGDNILVFGEYTEYTPKKEEIYYWKEDKGYRYDLNTGYRRQISSRAMRLQFLRHLNLVKEQENG